MYHAATAATGERAAELSNANEKSRSRPGTRLMNTPTTNRMSLTGKCTRLFETHFNPTFALGVKFVYDMLRSGKHYGWGSRQQRTLEEAASMCPTRRG